MKRSSVFLRVIAAFLALLVFCLGAAMAAGGLRLALLGGSLYYLTSGAGLIASAFLLLRGSKWGPRLYGLIVAATLLWGVAEVGFNIWGLLARLGLLAGLGLCILLTWWARRSSGRPSGKRKPAVPATVAAAAVALFIAMWTGVPQLHGKEAGATLPAASGQWLHYGRTLSGTRFSPLTQITPQNVEKLELAWMYRTGDLAAGGNQIDALGGLKGLYGISGLQSTPLQVGDTLYTCSERGMALAIDAETGRERWRFDPHARTKVLTHASCRGVAYHAQPNATGLCATRIFLGDIAAFLWALDARTGKPCPDFGAGGRVSLREGLSNPEIGYHMTSPGTVAKGVIVVGAWVADNQSVAEPSGVIRAYDVRTGKLAWAWDMGNPSQAGAPPAGRTYTPGTPNVWSFSSADEALNLIYLPLGNAAPDLWGGKRRPFDDLYSSSVVALDLTTGRPRWSFQTTHHDVWDYDVPAQPVLADIPMHGGTVPALVQPTKRGEIFILDRRTGKPIFPVTERAVPQGPAPGDYLSPTQPFSAISVRPPNLTEAQMWGLTPLDQLWCRIRFREARYDGPLTPPGEKPTINHPGSFGSISWGGVAIDEARHLILSNNSWVPHYIQLIRRDRAPEFARRRSDPTSYQWLPMEGSPYVARIQPFISPLRIPCNQPPWGHLQAIDLRSGRTVWRRVLGTGRDNGPMDKPLGIPVPIGVPSQGGPITTASGLTFLAATADRYIRAFETATGKELWRARLPAGGQATPMTYVSPVSGRQFVVIAAGGHPGLKSKRGDFLLAYALPR